MELNVLLNKNLVNLEFNLLNLLNDYDNLNKII